MRNRLSYACKKPAFRVAVLGAAAALGVFANPAAASAAVDNARVLPLDGGRAIEVAQADTSIQWYPPLDSSPLSVEFFADGTTTVRITGYEAARATGTKLTVGYQIGYPAALPGAVAHVITPGLNIGGDNTADLGVEIIPDLAVGVDLGTGTGWDASIIPEQELEVDLQPGGITDIPIIEDHQFDGDTATVRFAGIHGSVSGALGPVTLRPYAKAVTSSNDVVITYGAPHRF
ncbi:MspA family porin [Rhodococcus sp. HNM0563]|uniref:MspA family porin n=1 Tax=unclassified Rhodococcus (in: high G+C Gram-positive bacteria) TaxID=192944 RepID=UPI00146F223B|nr:MULTISPECIES: MspA family porin [unclassified Rhodococcus (in: high G+C Gram-positive bacteria)]MCK0093364.1 MspA family porin [Rhodococcus sp. F64268]NLU60766.1 MspA family porin [Rhodococcus sp. HNM0563]